LICLSSKDFVQKKTFRAQINRSTHKLIGSTKACIGGVADFTSVDCARLVAGVGWKAGCSLVAHEGEEALDGEVDVSIALLQHLQVGLLVSEAHLF